MYYQQYIYVAPKALSASSDPVVYLSENMTEPFDLLK